MTNQKDPEIIFSPLCQSVTRGGKTIQVDIYADVPGNWTLEVVDEYNNSVVWDDQFLLDTMALAEALKTIEEGIDSLIGQPSKRWLGSHLH